MLHFWWFWLTLLHPDYTNTAPAVASASSDRVIQCIPPWWPGELSVAQEHAGTVGFRPQNYSKGMIRIISTCLHLSERRVAKGTGAAVLIMWSPGRPEVMSKSWSVMNAQHPCMIQKFKSQQKIAEAQVYIASVVLILKQ